MFRIQYIVRGALTVALAGGAVGCTSDHTVLMAPVTNRLFLSYVSIGNSITAGFQSAHHGAMV
jgi:hypothetical protein